MLRLANPTVRVTSRRAAFAAALDLPVAPPHYREDLLLCLGLRPGSVGQLCAAAARLVTGVLPLVRPYAAEVARAAGGDLADALTDGRLDPATCDQLTRPAHRPPRPRREPSPVPAPRVAGQWVTVPVPDAPVTGAHPSPQEPAADGAVRPSRLDPAIAARLKRDPAGLVAAVVQQHDTGEVLMLAWMDDEALHRTLTTGRATYWSRSRGEYWVKGETSGHHQWVRAVRAGLRRRRAAGRVDQVGAGLPHRRPHLLRRRRCRRRGRSGCRDASGTGGRPARSPRRSSPSWPDRRVVPVTRRLLADGETPVGVYRKLAGSRRARSCWSRPSRARPAAWPGRATSFVGVRSAGDADRAGRRGGVAGRRRRPACPTAGDPLEVLRETVAGAGRRPAPDAAAACRR